MSQDPQRNARLIAEAQAKLTSLVHALVVKGFHGVVGVSLHVQDGSINHVKANTESVTK